MLAMIKAAMATLFKRSDAPLYRVFIGADWKPIAQHLSQEQCFEVHAVLHAPLVESDALEKVAVAISCLGTWPKRNGWFEASLDEATRVLAAILPHAAEECCAQQSSCGADVPPPKRRRGPKGALPIPEAEGALPIPEAEGALPIPEAEGVLPGPEAKGEQCQEAAPNPPAESAAPAEEIDASTAPESTESCVIDDDAVGEEGVEKDPLWDYVTPCTTRDAAKAVDLRAVLEARCGKDGAKSLLAHTKATVAQDASGKKNRVLKLDGSFIKLKSEV